MLSALISHIFIIFITSVIQVVTKLFHSGKTKTFLLKNDYEIYLNNGMVVDEEENMYAFELYGHNFVKTNLLSKCRSKYGTKHTEWKWY